MAYSGENENCTTAYDHQRFSNQNDNLQMLGDMRLNDGMDKMH